MDETNTRDLTPALLAQAREIIASEAAAIGGMADRLGDDLVAALQLIHRRTGPDLPGVLVVSGIGKSGLVGQRISASFASTGTPSHVLHPVEAVHGDVGRVRKNDVALLLSYGGETEELLRLIDVLKRIGAPIIAITSRRTSSLGRLADICLELGPIEEAGPLQLAPTTSSNCMSVLGDVLVLGVMGLRKFSAEDFAAFHPAGSLGRKLMKVEQAMSFKVGENFSPAPDHLTLREVLARDAQGVRRAGAIVLVDAVGRLTGIFTDGDLRRYLRSGDGSVLDTPINKLMTAGPKHVHKDVPVGTAMSLLNRYRIDELPVVDDAGCVLGLIDVQDLVSLRLMDGN
jgi:arabinose-5-phosphate isomerase